MNLPPQKVDRPSVVLNLETVNEIEAELTKLKADLEQLRAERDYCRAGWVDALFCHLWAEQEVDEAKALERAEGTVAEELAAYRKSGESKGGSHGA